MKLSIIDEIRRITWVSLTNSLLLSDIFVADLLGFNFEGNKAAGLVNNLFPWFPIKIKGKYFVITKIPWLIVLRHPFAVSIFNQIPRYFFLWLHRDIRLLVIFSNSWENICMIEFTASKSSNNLNFKFF